MASSNVQYYEKQKELQDTLTTCEQRRMDLEKQLRISLQSGQTSSKMKAARLHTYWKKICEDEKRAKLRNETLMREFERIDAHMYQMNARTQHLAVMKKQYEDYISRTYPQWNELMYGKPQIQPQPAQVDQNQQAAKESNTPNSITQSQPVIQRQEESPQYSRISHQPTSTHSTVTASVSSLSMQPTISKASHQMSQETVPKKDIVESGIYQNLPSSYSEPSSKAQHHEESPSKLKADATSQPVQSVEIHSSSRETVQSFYNQMQPPDEGEEEEDISDFGTDPEIPMAESAKNTIVPADTNKTSNGIGTASHGIVKPELSIDGLLSLLRLIENDIPDAFSLEGYYRSSWPETSIKNDIIRKANSNGDLSQIDANLISMVVLEQITLIIRSLSEKCVIPDSVLQGDISNLTPQKLSQHLSSEAQVVWKALYSHFTKLVTSQVMKSYELSAIFTPSMVSDNTAQDKAHTFLVQLLENVEKEDTEKQPLKTTGKSLSPAATLEGSGSFMDDGNVPRLKFGSLLDKPLSDDDSSFINSLPRDAVPLNETAAYKSMISTGGSDRPRHQSSTQEDTDDDVEKQVVSALSKPAFVHLSPRKKVDVDEPSEASSQTLQTTSHVYVPTALETKSPRQPAVTAKPKFQGVRISSDLDTDTEVDAGIFGSSRQAGDNYDFDFYD